MISAGKVCCLIESKHWRCLTLPTTALHRQPTVTHTVLPLEQQSATVNIPRSDGVGAITPKFVILNCLSIFLESLPFYILYFSYIYLYTIYKKRNVFFNTFKGFTFTRQNSILFLFLFFCPAHTSRPTPAGVERWRWEWVWGFQSLVYSV